MCINYAMTDVVVTQKLETEKRSAQRRVELLERQLSLKEDQIQQLLVCFLCLSAFVQ